MQRTTSEIDGRPPYGVGPCNRFRCIPPLSRYNAQLDGRIQFNKNLSRANATGTKNLSYIYVRHVYLEIYVNLTCGIFFRSSLATIANSYAPPLPDPIPLEFRTSSAFFRVGTLRFYGVRLSRARGGRTPHSIQRGTPVRAPKIRRKPSTRPRTIATTRFYSEGVWTPCLLGK